MAAHEKAPPGLQTGEAGTAFLDRNRFHNTGPISAAQVDCSLGTSRHALTRRQAEMLGVALALIAAP